MLARVSKKRRRVVLAAKRRADESGHFKTPSVVKVCVRSLATVLRSTSRCVVVLGMTESGTSRS